MCRILGVASRAPISPALLHTFGQLASQGKVPSDYGCGPVAAKVGHPDGWGIAALSPAGEVYRRAATSAATDPDFDRAADEVRRLGGDVVLLAHVRRVLDSSLVAEEHALPFRRETGSGILYYAQDGWVEKFGLQGGGTDARHALDQVLPAVTARFEKRAFGDAINGVRAVWGQRYPRRLSALTAVVAGEKGLLAHRDGGNCPLYFTLHLAETKEMTLVASEVLPGVEARWRLLRNGESVAIQRAAAG